MKEKGGGYPWAEPPPHQWRKENLKIKRSPGCRMWEKKEISKSGGLCPYKMSHSSG